MANLVDLILEWWVSVIENNIAYIKPYINLENIACIVYIKHTYI